MLMGITNGLFWRSDARISYRQIRRSATYLIMYLDRHQSLKAFKTTKVLKPMISSHGRRHLKWCKHLSPPLPAVDYSKLAKVPTTCHLHHSRHVRGQPFRVVETTRTSLPDAVAARASLLVIPAASFPVERLFSGTGQVDAARTAFLSPDTLTFVLHA